MGAQILYTKKTILFIHNLLAEKYFDDVNEKNLIIWIFSKLRAPYRNSLEFTISFNELKGIAKIKDYRRKGYLLSWISDFVDKYTHEKLFLKYPEMRDSEKVPIFDNVYISKDRETVRFYITPELDYLLRKPYCTVPAAIYFKASEPVSRLILLIAMKKGYSDNRSFYLSDLYDELKISKNNSPSMIESRYLNSVIELMSPIMPSISFERIGERKGIQYIFHWSVEEQRKQQANEISEKTKNKKDGYNDLSSNNEVENNTESKNEQKYEDYSDYADLFGDLPLDM